MVIGAADIVGFAGFKVLAYVRHRKHGISEKRGCPMMTAKNSERQSVESAVKEAAINRAIRTVIFPRPIRIEQPDNDRFSSVLDCRVSDLHFVDPFGHRVII